MKVKKLRRNQWDEDSVVEVHLDPRNTDPGHRSFDVYRPDGTILGIIWEYSGTLDTKIKGSRLVRRGKLRTFWSCSEPGSNSRNYWMYLESQADAIRSLISDYERGAR